MVLTSADALGHLDGDHVGTGGLDRLVQVDPPLVELQPAGLLDGIHDLLTGDRAKEPPVVARLVGDRQDGLAQQPGGLLRALGGLRRGPLGRLLAALGLGDGRRRGRLGKLARHEVITQVAGRDVDDRAALAERLDLLQQDGLGQPPALGRTEAGRVTGALDRARAAPGGGGMRRSRGTSGSCPCRSPRA